MSAMWILAGGFARSSGSGRGRSWTFEAWRSVQSSRATGIGHFQTFLAANCGTKSRHSSVIGGNYPCYKTGGVRLIICQAATLMK